MIDLLSWLGNLIVDEILRGILEYFLENIFLFVVVAGWAIIRASGITIRTGQHGLLFSFGRAKRVLDPGFRILIPFLQTVRLVPTRARTMNLAAQRVTTFDGLVFDVDVNLVYQVVDVRKALIEVDDLERAMHQMLGLSVQELLRGLERPMMRVSDALDRELAENMQARLDPWGVAVERAGFTTITPTAETLRLTQLSELGHEKYRRFSDLRHGTGAAALALPMLGVRYVIPRRRLLIERDHAAARRRRLTAMVRRVARDEEMGDMRLIKRVMQRVTHQGEPK